MTTHNRGYTESIGVPSRRALLGALAGASVVTPLVALSWVDGLTHLSQHYGDAPALMQRSAEGRALSRDRYHSAEVAFAPIEAGFFSDPHHIRDTLHCAGAVAKLGLCAYLLDIGFADAWNAEHIRQDITKALAYANATAFGHECPEMARLAHILTPYWKWGYPHRIGDPVMDDGEFTHEQICSLMRALLDRLRDVTGHPGLGRKYRDGRGGNDAVS